MTPVATGTTMSLLRNFITSAVILLVVCSCGYSRIFFSKIGAKVNPTPHNVITSSPENGFLVSGTVVGNVGDDVSLAVVAVTWWKTEWRVAGYTILPHPGKFYLFLPEGSHNLLVFADLNHDGTVNGNELISREGVPDTVVVERGRALHGIITSHDIMTEAANPRVSEFPLELELPEITTSRKSVHFPAGEITTIDDERFGEDNGYHGLYEPAVYFERVSGFFYMLEEYDPAKIPVIFVHGAGGTPKDWEYLVGGLDRQRFQPWFFYYPSGLRLDAVAAVFYELFLSGSSVRSDKLVIAALSQGGLLARTALGRCMQTEGGTMPSLFVSFCTPYGGVESAATFARKSPVILPSWIDLADDSDYMKTLRLREPLAGTKFYLFFAYGNSHLFRIGPNDDGAVSLKSQLEPKAQREATRIYGFDETHSEILRNKEVMEDFNAILAEAR
jgi:pimeloyl-ACP methyl ester carboxylesterase